MNENKLPQTQSTNHLWTVWRQGDDGNPYLINDNLTEAEADRLVAEFEARRHKQVYWKRQA